MLIGGGQNLLEAFDLNSQIITFHSMLQRAIKRDIFSFYAAKELFIDFSYLCKINLWFYDGIIHEDHLFAGLLFAQSKAIYILPQKLYNYLLRKSSTVSGWNKNEIPSYIVPLLDYFSYNQARKYFRIYSLTITIQSLYDFSANIKSDIRDDFLAFTCRYLLEIIIDIYGFNKDPYRIRVQVTELLKAFGEDSFILSKKVREYYKYYTNPKCLKYIMVKKRIEAFISPYYQTLKSIERKFRHWRKNLRNK